MSDLMDVKAVYDMLGGTIGRDKIYQLMKTDLIPSVKIGNKGKMVTRRKFVERFINAMFEKPIQNDIIESCPANLKGFKRI